MGEFTRRAMESILSDAEKDATITRLTEELEATKACEPCQRDDHDNCTGDCSSMCCALADAERERDSALADLAAWKERCVAADRDRNALADQRDSLAASLEAKDAELSELRARVEAAVVYCRNVNPGGLGYELLAILAPPEAPTDKGPE